jgi:hypothetical protein
LICVFEIKEFIESGNNKKSSNRNWRWNENR